MAQANGRSRARIKVTEKWQADELADPADTPSWNAVVIHDCENASNNTPLEADSIP